MNHVAALHAADVVSQSESGGKAKSVIFVFLSGGLTQHDSFDPKPDAPVDIRGEFSPIATQTPGVSICEHLPMLAACSQHWSLIRSLTTPYNEHSQGQNCRTDLQSLPDLDLLRTGPESRLVTDGHIPVTGAHRRLRGTQTTSGHTDDVGARDPQLLDFAEQRELSCRFSFAARLTQKFVQFPCAVCKGWALDTRSVQHGDE